MDGWQVGKGQMKCSSDGSESNSVSLVGGAKERCAIPNFGYFEIE